MEEVGAAIKEIIHFKTIRGKFSSVHPDLAAAGITRVEVGEKGLHFITGDEPADLEELDEEDMLMRAIAMSLEEEKEENREVAEEELFFAKDDSKNKMLASIPPHGVEEEEELLKMAIAMSLEEQ